MQLNQDQQHALAMIEQFVHHDTQHHAFILKGSAGTGKTTMIKSIIEMIDKTGERSDILTKRTVRVIAPTGRAARVLSAKIRPFGAGTIHREIYALDRAVVYEEAINENDPGIRFHFPLKTENPSNVIFIVDESSMVGDTDNHADDIYFGSGRVLKDLLTYARVAREGRETAINCKIIFVGDPAQLPPVGNGDLSPAMSAEYLAQHYGVKSQSFELRQVMRQAEGSGILTSATGLRDDIVSKRFNRFELAVNADLEHLNLSSAFDTYLTARQQKKTCVFISHSNAQVTSLNRVLRGRIWGEERLPIQRNEILLINRSGRLCSRGEHGEIILDDCIVLTNGELIKVIDFSDSEQRSVSVRTKTGTEKVLLSFRYVHFMFKNEMGEMIHSGAFIIENLLESKERELSALEIRALLVDFRMRHPKLKPNTEEFTTALLSDPYFNAFQVKYGYAMTCHKAQGGEWDHAFVEFSQSNANESFFRWAYTAITRAKTKLSVVNAPRFTSTSGMKFAGAKVMPAPSMVVTTAPIPAPVATSAPTLPPITEPRIMPPPAPTLAPIVPTVTTPAPMPALQTTTVAIDFAGQPVALYRYYQALSEALQTIGIQVVQVIHQQYRERYCLTSAGTIVWFEYLYKGNYQVSGINPMAQLPNQIELLAQAMPVIKQVLYATDSDESQAEQVLPEFIVQFIQQVQNILAPTNIKLVKYEPMNYRLRLYFAQDTHRASIDFSYNSKEQWTSSSEVGGVGASRGIFQFIQQGLQAM